MTMLIALTWSQGIILMQLINLAATILAIVAVTGSRRE
jgi:hypothetical protein